MANDYSGRQIRLTTTGQIPLGNLKIKGGIWTGMTAPATFSMTDEAGRNFDFTAYQSNYPVLIGELGWLSGPINITSLPTGEVVLFLGTK